MGSSQRPAEENSTVTCGGKGWKETELRWRVMVGERLQRGSREGLDSIWSIPRTQYIHLIKGYISAGLADAWEVEV